MSKPFIDVAAGLIMQADGSLLLAQRPHDKPWPGWWELPGGKIEAGETVLQALARELKEELDIDVTAATPWVTYVHEYPKNIVRLAFCRVTGWNGAPTGIEGQALTWVDPHQTLPVGPLLPATEPPLRWLQVPDQYLLTSIGEQANLKNFLEKLGLALKAGIKLVQFREPAWASKAPQTEVYDGLKQVLQCCREFNAKCLINSVHPESWWDLADGVHFRAADAAKLNAAQPAPDSNALAPSNTTSTAVSIEAATQLARSNVHLNVKRLIGLSAHTPSDLALARALNADFAVLGHVLETPSHPDQASLGWAQFAALTRDAGLPVFAIGGQSASTLEQAKQHGAHGVAGIRHLIASPQAV